MQQMKRVEAAEMKLLRPWGSYTLLHDKHNEEIRQELNVTNIIDITDGKPFFVVDSIVYLSKYSNINLQPEETSDVPRNAAVTNFKLILKDNGIKHGHMLLVMMWVCIYLMMWNSACPFSLTTVIQNHSTGVWVTWWWITSIIILIVISWVTWVTGVIWVTTTIWWGVIIRTRSLKQIIHIVWHSILVSNFLFTQQHNEDITEEFVYQQFNMNLTECESQPLWWEAGN